MPLKWANILNSWLTQVVVWVSSSLLFMIAYNPSRWVNHILCYLWANFWVFSFFFLNCVCVHTHTGADRNQKTLLELELQVTVSCSVGARNWTPVLCKNQHSQLLSQFSAPPSFLCAVGNCIALNTEFSFDLGCLSTLEVETERFEIQGYPQLQRT